MVLHYGSKTKKLVVLSTKESVCITFLSRFYHVNLHKFLVEDFDHVPNIIRHAFVDSLRCDTSDHPVLVTEPAWNTPENRERMAEILFEEFKVPAFYIANSGVLTAYGI